MITSSVTSYNAKFLAFQKLFTERKGNGERKGTLDFAVFMWAVTNRTWNFLSHLHRTPKITKDTQILKQKNQLIKWKNSFKKWETFIVVSDCKMNIVFVTEEGLHL